MDKESSLEKILQEAQLEGQLDSTGTFSVDWKAAARKYGEMARLMPTRWVWAAVQAAVLLGSSAVNLSALGGGLRLEIHFLHGLLDGLAQLSDPETVLHESPEASPAAKLLRTSFVWASALEMESLDFRVEGPQGGYNYNICAQTEAPPRLLRLPSGPPKEGKVTLTLQLCGNDQVFGAATRFHADLSSSIANRLCYCPIPVTLDGRLIERGEPLRNQSQEAIRGNRLLRRLVLAPPDPEALAAELPACLANAWPAAQVLIDGHPCWKSPQPLNPLGILEIGGDLRGGRIVDIPAGRLDSRMVEVGKDATGRRRILQLGYDPHIDKQGQYLRCRAIFYRLNEPAGHLQLVHHGVQLTTVEIPELARSGWTIVLASHRIKVDASGMTAIEDQDHQQRLDWALDSVAAIYRRHLSPSQTA